MILANKGTGLYNATFENNLIKSATNIPTGLLSINNIFNQNPLFKDIKSADYSVSQNSPAKGNAIPILTIMDDIENNPRNQQPTIGCYE